MMRNDGAIAMVTNSEHRLSVGEYAEWTQLVRSNTLHSWTHVIDHRGDVLHFDEHTIDAILEQTSYFVILLSFDSLSIHSEGAIIFYEKHLFLAMSKLKEAAAQYTNDDTLYFWFTISKFKDSEIRRFIDS